MQNTEKLRSISRLLVLVLAYSLPGYFASAQDVEDIINKYRNEQAVISSIKETLTITGKNGKLAASSSVFKEKVLIGNQSPGIYNTEYIYHSYFNKLEDYEEEALIPYRNGYKKLHSSSSKTIHSEQDNIFYDDAKQTIISFSGLAPGSLIRTNYTISHTDVHMLPVYYFQENLRVAQSIYEVTAPKYVDVRFVLKGTDADKVVQTKHENKNTVTYTFTATDLPAFKDYSDAPSLAWHGLHIVPYIAGYHMPDAAPVEMLSNPAHLYKYLYEYIRHINVKEDAALNKEVDDITSGITTQRDKAARIYKWVQDNMHYVAFEDSLEGFIPRQAADIYKRKFGDCKDMSSILVAMCRRAGIPAYFTWIGTRSKPYTYEETPLPLVDNHMICAINVDSSWIFLDGTHSLIPFGRVPSGLQGKQAMIAINEKEYKIVMVPETDASQNVFIDSSFIRINGKDLAGSSVMDFTGYMSWDVQTSMMYTKEKDREQTTRAFNLRGSNKYVQDNYLYIANETGNKDTRLTASFTIGDYVQKVGNEYYVNMNLKRNYDENHIDTQGRKIPYYFKYKDIEKEVVVLDVPAGYHVSYLPGDATHSLNGIWNYSISYKKLDGKVLLNKEYHLNSMVIPVARFNEHNSMIEELKKQYKESVVLTADN